MQTSFASSVVQWQRSHGRHDLPWQNSQDPYKVWLSEIMLQQTQVVTVRTYFSRFLARCPNVRSLADAPLDEVLGLWSGLGYYTRARNLHQCAQLIMLQFGGHFPNRADVLQTLPGIGRSTAAAISSLCFGERVAILDANVKRVLTRSQGFEADLAQAANERQLWQIANNLVPAAEETIAPDTMARYTQGMMDLGATVCLPKKPLCPQCPIHSHCKAAAYGHPEKYPVRTRKLKRSSQSLWLLWARRKDGAVWLCKRPTPGVWAGLFCFPLMDSEIALTAALQSDPFKEITVMPTVRHVLTHMDLFLHPRVVQWDSDKYVDQQGQWFLPIQWQNAGLPAPIRKLLEHTIF
jgi:A/G-specific adenine glycosylase